MSSKKLTNMMREKISGPTEENSFHYGDWYLLQNDQKFIIRKICDNCDMFEDAADKFGKENFKLKKELAIYKKVCDKLCNKIYELYRKGYGEICDICNLCDCSCCGARCIEDGFEKEFINENIIPCVLDQVRKELEGEKENGN